MLNHRRKTWYAAGAVVALFGVIALVMSSDYLFGFSTSSALWSGSGWCEKTAFERTGTEYRITFINASTKKPIACETIKVYEEDPLCNAPTCPTFIEAHKGRTAQDGSLAVPQRKIPGRIYRPDTDGAGFTADQNPLYAFDADAYVHTEIPYQSFAKTLEDYEAMTVELFPGEDDAAGWESDY